MTSIASVRGRDREEQCDQVVKMGGGAEWYLPGM